MKLIQSKITILKLCTQKKRKREKERKSRKKSENNLE